MMTFKRITICFFVALMLLTAMVPSAAAAGDDNNLTIHYTYEDIPIQGARFQVYMAGTVAPDGSLSLSGDFRKYPVEVNGLTSSGMQSAANTLYAYAQRDQLQPNQTVATNTGGYAVVHSLPRGLYLLTSTARRMGDDVFVSQPQLIAVTDDIILMVKSEIRQSPSEPLTLSVLKKWNDAGIQNQRPEFLLVSLLRDGVVDQTVTLNAQCSWRHTWTELDPTSDWLVVEDCPEHYTVTVQREGETFLLTNTRPAPPESPSVPPEDTTGNSTETPAIPQTGMRWHLVLVLLFLGICLIAAGFHLRRKEHKDA